MHSRYDLTIYEAAPSVSCMTNPMPPNAISFGMQAAIYARARPSYPNALFDWIAIQAPDTKQVWDVGTGSGQAAISLAAHFDHVHATDIDARQIDLAPVHSRVSYAVASAYASGLPENSVGAVTVATALHWFDFARFWPEVKRVSQPGAIFCGWAYQDFQTDADVRQYLLGPIWDVVDPYWASGNRMCLAGYSVDNTAMPFVPINTPHFFCELQWRAEDIAAFMRSWSAHKKACLDGHEERLNEIEEKALTILGDSVRNFTMPLTVLAGRVG